MMISFIVPIYNVENYLEDCIKSLVHIGSNDIEILLINDGSSDNSSSICEIYAATDKRIKVIHQKNSGVSVARNSGLSIAKGEWICFVDADDMLSADFEYKIISQLNTKYDVVFFRYIKIIEGKEMNAKEGEDGACEVSGKDIDDIRRGILDKDYRGFEKYKNNFMDFVAPWGCIYKNSLIKNYRFPEGIIWSEDRIFKFQVLKNAKCIRILSAYGYCYRQHGKSITYSYKDNTMENCYDMCSRMKKLVDAEKDTRFVEAFNLMVVRQCLFCIKKSIYHPDNKQSRAKRINEVRRWRNEKIFSDSLEHVSIQMFKKVIIRIPAYFMRRKLYSILDVLYIIKQKME